MGHQQLFGFTNGTPRSTPRDASPTKAGIRSVRGCIQCIQARTPANFELAPVRLAPCREGYKVTGATDATDTTGAVDATAAVPTVRHAAGTTGTVSAAAGTTGTVSAATGTTTASDAPVAADASLSPYTSRLWRLSRSLTSAVIPARCQKKLEKAELASLGVEAEGSLPAWGSRHTLGTCV